MKNIKNFLTFIKEDYGTYGYDDYFDEGPQPGDPEYHEPEHEEEESDDYGYLWHEINKGILDSTYDNIGYSPATIEMLWDSGYITDLNGKWVFTEEGKKKFPTEETLVNYIDTYYDSTDNYPSEAPYMRGYEPES